MKFTANPVVVIIVSLMVAGCGSEAERVIHSPDGKITIQFKLISGVPYYSVHHNSTVILADSRLGFHFQDELPIEDNLRIIDAQYRTLDETWTQPWGEAKDIRNHYNEMEILLKEKTKLARQMKIVFRVFDDGIGFRYELPEQENLKDFIL